MINNQFENTDAVLSELLGSLHKMGDTIDFYFDQFEEGEMLNPFLAGGGVNSMGSYEALPPEFFNGFGIRRLILDSPHGRLSLSEKDFIDIMNKNTASLRWRDLKTDLMMEDLKTLFGNCQIVEFANWSDVANASDIWDNLRRDIIMPLKRNDFDFVFYLGDTAKKMTFEVDEILDIISDYSLHGRVTLILNEQHAANMWEIRNGRDSSHAGFSTSPGLKEKSRCLFDLMDISHLIIDSFPSTLSFSRQSQFEITPEKRFETLGSGRKYFDAGYILGLILKNDLLHSTILGLAVSEVYTENGRKPDSKMLIGYIEKYKGEIESFKDEKNQLSTA